MVYSYSSRKRIMMEAAARYPDDPELHAIPAWAWLLFVVVISLVMVVR